MKIRLIFCIVALILIAACSEQETSKDTQNKKTEYVLAFSWQPAFCETASRKRECKTQTKERYDAKHFTLHGLWPQPGSNIYCRVNNAQVKTDKQGKWNNLDVPRVSSQLWEKLKRVMPGTMSSLHKHEWVKHGTCYGDSIEEYYATSVWLMERLNASKLQILFQDNIGLELSGKEIRSAFEESFGIGAGDRLRISCKKDQNSGRQLITELTLGLSGDITSNSKLPILIADSPKTKPGCPDGIVDPVGLQ